MSFFRTVFSLCSGTELFPKMLEKPSLFRAFFHLFLLLILCTAGVVVAAWLLNRDNVNLVCDRFIERTGGFEIKPDEIVIGKEKDRSRGYKLTETLRFDYFAKAEDCKEEAVANSVDCSFCRIRRHRLLIYASLMGGFFFLNLKMPCKMRSKLSDLAIFFF
jgi:hypothetical protein